LDKFCALAFRTNFCPKTADWSFLTKFLDFMAQNGLKINIDKKHLPL
jgi:hypothetical protein